MDAASARWCSIDVVSSSGSDEIFVICYSSFFDIFLVYAPLKCHVGLMTH